MALNFEGEKLTVFQRAANRLNSHPDSFRFSELWNEKRLTVRKMAAELKRTKEKFILFRKRAQASQTLKEAQTIKQKRK